MNVLVLTPEPIGAQRLRDALDTGEGDPGEVERRFDLAVESATV